MPLYSQGDVTLSIRMPTLSPKLGGPGIPWIRGLQERVGKPPLGKVFSLFTCAGNLSALPKAHPGAWQPVLPSQVEMQGWSEQRVNPEETGPGRAGEHGVQSLFDNAGKQCNITCLLDCNG